MKEDFRHNVQRRALDEQLSTLLRSALTAPGMSVRPCQGEGIMSGYVLADVSWADEDARKA